MYHIMLFTGQRLDETGLYFYNARYYDPTIGRFISADPIISNPTNPQEFNHYSYCLNNPLRYVDPTGHQIEAMQAYYEQLCEENDIDPDAGLALIIEDGVVVAAVHIESFEGWVEETPNPYDYWVEESAWEKAVSMGLLVGTISLADDWIPVWGQITTAIGYIGGFIAGGIIGIFVKELISVKISFTGKRSGETIDDLKNNPGKWEKTGEKTEPATGKKYGGGTSVEETYRNRETGQVVERHRIYDRNGEVVHDHYRIK
jgi:RHS repeat-associated protein